MVCVSSFIKIEVGGLVLLFNTIKDYIIYGLLYRNIIILGFRGRRYVLSVCFFDVAFVVMTNDVLASNK